MSAILAVLTLPWPHRDLWPNGRAHHMAVHRLRRAQQASTRAEGLARGLHLLIGRVPAGATIGLHWTFHPKTARGCDDDNAEAAMKAARDQIAALIGVDDRLFRATREMGAPVKGGLVRATVRLIDAQDGWQHVGDAAAQVIQSTIERHQ